MASIRVNFSFGKKKDKDWKLLKLQFPGWDKKGKKSQGDSNGIMNINNQSAVHQQLSI